MAGAAFGKYHLVAELGHGGMADVFLAVQAGPAGSGFKKLTVIKRLRQSLAEEPEFAAMLVDEARIAARLNHPNVVQTNEVGEVSGQYFIAMEYLDGQPLHRIQHRSTSRVKAGKETPLTREQQYLIVMDSLAGLHHAHELADYDGTPLQIVHRDMTPHNVFITYEGQVKVVDFGIAKAAGRVAETRQGVVKGKVRYMPPEQAVGQAIDRRADIFSVGVMLWEAAVGRRMWQDKDDMEIVQALLAGELPPSPKVIDPTVPDTIDAICKRALAKKPDDRYSNAEDFRAALEQFMAESGLLIDARRKLARSVSELFEDKRIEIRAIIEKQLSQLDVGKSGEFRAVPLPTDSSTTAASSMSIPLDEAPTLLADPKTSVYTRIQPRWKRRIAILGGAAAAVIAVLIVRVALHRAPGPASLTAASKEQTPASISLKVTGSPSNAKVSIDDGAPVSLPLDTTVVRNDGLHHVRVEADGFEPRTENVSFGQDLAVSIDLVPTNAAAIASSKSKQGSVARTNDHPPQPPAPTWANVHSASPPVTTTKTDSPAITSPPVPALISSQRPTDPKRKVLDPGDPWNDK